MTTIDQFQELKATSNFIKWSEIKASTAIKLLKDFPKCGIRYKNFDGHGLVVVHPMAMNDLSLILSKKKAAEIKSTKSSNICTIPLTIAKAARI